MVKHCGVDQGRADGQSLSVTQREHLAHPMDFFPKKGYRYYYII